MNPVRNIFLKTIRLYQYFFSPLLGDSCRFYPSCSEYAYRSVIKYGIFKGGWKGAKRILRCGPWSRGGVDLP